jgi:hypothetical protein
MLRGTALLLIVLLVAGCGYLEGDTSATTTATTTTTPDAGPMVSSSVPTTTAATDSPCLAGDRPFSDAGVISAFGGPNGDATQISGVQWAAYEGCEQVVVDFLTADGAPAGALDAAGVEFDAASGVIRVSLAPAIARSAVADSRFDGELITRSYVVATGDGLAVDVHLAAGSAYAVRAYEVDSPSRVVVDVKADAEAQPVIGATFGQDVVIVEPPTGVISAPLRVSGYVKGTFEKVTGALVVDGTEVSTTTVTPVTASRIWREFSMVFREVPTSPIDLVVTPAGKDDLALHVAVDATPVDTPTATDM